MTSLFAKNSTAAHGPRAVNVITVCPSCGHKGTFESLGVNDLLLDGQTWIGSRICPNRSCKAVIFFFGKQDSLEFYPATRFSYDKADIPQKILSAYEEAITCHANKCFTASAIMIRKTLEVLCADQGAKGANLKERINSLKTKLVIPSELLEGLDEIRILGNNAAHVESTDYDNIGQEELDISLEFTRELLKATYQYKSILAKLKGMKKTGIT